MYFIIGISLSCIFLFVLNAAATVFAIGLWHIVGRHVGQNWTSRRRAAFIFALRIFPVVSALLFVSFFLLPAYLKFEPRASRETIGTVQMALSVVSFAGIFTALYRVLRSRLITRRLISGWLNKAEPLFIKGVTVPVYRICHPFPVIAVVGIFRPQMFVAEQVFDSLTAEEFQAAITHENGHLAARDNLKRILMRICRDSLIIPLGRNLDSEWSISAEAGADEYAAQSGGNPSAINLAAALVKIARIVPRGAKPSIPAGAYLIEEQTAAIAFRVEKLLNITERRSTAVKPNSKSAIRLIACLCLAAVLFLAADYNFLYRIHQTLELVVKFQQ